MSGYVVSRPVSNSTLAPNVGLEPTTLRLRVSCSTDWICRQSSCFELNIGARLLIDPRPWDHPMPSRPQPPFVSSMSTSSRPCQSRLSYAKLFSSLSTSSLLRQPRLVSFKPCRSATFLSFFFCMRSFFVKFFFLCMCARVFVKHYQVRGPIMVSHALIFGCLAKV